MFLNSTESPEKDILAALAEGFFSAKCPKYSDNNYEKYVLVNANTYKCSFQRTDYNPEPDEAIFKCTKMDGHIVVSTYTDLLDKKFKPKVTNFHGKLISLIDGNDVDTDTGLSGKYVSYEFEMDCNKVIRGRIININELVDTGLYNETTVRDAYQAIGDFAEVINNVQDRCYPVYLHIPFCEDCNYLFEYQSFSFTEEVNKTCINYKFLGIISEDVTKDDITKGKLDRKSKLGYHSEYSPFLMPYEVRHLTDALKTAKRGSKKVFNLEDYAKYAIQTYFIMNRFYPKMVFKTKYGVFYVVYDRAADYATLYYSEEEYTPMESIPGYGDFCSACEIIKNKLEELSKKESIE